MNKNILFVISNSSFGGGEKVFEQIISFIDKSKFSCFIACHPEGPLIERIREKAAVLPLDLSFQFNIYNFFYLAKLIKSRKIDIVHTQGARADFFGRIAARIAGVPYVVSTVAMPTEGFDVNILKKSVYVFLERLTEKFVHKFTTCSNTLKDALINRHDIPEEKVTVIYNGVDLNEYRFGAEGADKVRSELGISRDTILAGTVCRLVWQKGLPYYLRAIKLLIDKHPSINIKHLIVGEGPDRLKLEKQVKESGLGNNVIFTGFRNDINSVISALDIFVLPSLREGQPIILLEVMAVARPIVATRIEGVSQTIIDNENGVLVPPSDPSALADAIFRLSDDPKLRGLLSSNAQTYVKKYFDVKDIVKQYEKVYLETGPSHAQ